MQSERIGINGLVAFPKLKGIAEGVWAFSLRQLGKRGFTKVNLAVYFFSLVLVIGMIGAAVMASDPPVFQKNHIQAAHVNLTYTESEGVLHILAQTRPFYGASMFPSLAEGNTALVEKYTEQKIKPGMIVIYKTEDLAVAHRVIATQNDGTVVVQGDNSNSEEMLTEREITHIMIGVLYT